MNRVVDERWADAVGCAGGHWPILAAVRPVRSEAAGGAVASDVRQWLATGMVLGPSTGTALFGL